MRLLPLLLLASLAMPALSQVPNSAEDSQTEPEETRADVHAEARPAQAITTTVESSRADIPAPDSPGDDRSENQPEEQESVDRPWWQYYFLSGDSLAQWLLTVAAVIGTGASVYAVILLKRTLGANKLLLRQGRRMNIAAVRAAKAAEDTIKQNRAWVCLTEEFDFKTFAKEDGAKAHLTISFTLRNAGSSPALNLRTASVLAPDVPEPVRKAIIGRAITADSRVLGPGQPVYLNADIEQKFIEPITTEKPLALISFIACVYDTVHDESYILESYSKLTIHRDEGGSLVITDAPHGRKSRILRVDPPQARALGEHI